MVDKRTFLKLSLFGVGVLTTYKLFWTKDTTDTLLILQNDLFPPINEKLNISYINAREYLSYIIHHKRVSDDTKEFIRNSLKWLDEEADSLYNTTYSKLDKNKREKVLESISKESWGENFIETILTFIFESLFGDPVYGVNKDEIGWKWVKHTPGLPRPKTRFDG